jgi:hypothetical protein
LFFIFGWNCKGTHKANLFRSCIVCLYLHSRRKSNYQEWVWSNKSVLTWPHFCVCPKLGSVFPTSYGVDFAFNL